MAKKLKCDEEFAELLLAGQACDAFLSVQPGLAGAAGLCRVIAGAIRRHVLTDQNGKTIQRAGNELSVIESQLLGVYTRIIDVAIFADASAEIHSTQQAIAETADAMGRTTYE